MSGRMSWTYDVARVMGFDHVAEADVSYGRAFSDAHLVVLTRAPRGASEWDKGYAQGARDAFTYQPRPTVESSR